jgi:hypothetical protein
MWDILNYFASSPWRIPPRRAVPTRGGFHHGATKIAEGAPIGGISSQAKNTTAKLKTLKFKNRTNFFKRINMLRVG